MKILLIEDDPVTSDILEQNLKSWGYEVICKDNGSEAWELLQQEDSPKMAIMDWMIPGLSGIELCQKLRAKPSGTYVYVIMLTSLSEKIHVVQGLEAGADDYLTKPFNPMELKVRIHAGKRILNLENELLVALGQLKRLAAAPQLETLHYKELLTSLEEEIIRLICSGKSYEEMARTFHLSPDWVKANVQNILHKMKVNTQQEMIALALQDGLLQEKTLMPH